MDSFISKAKEIAKALVALFAAPLTYVANQLIADKPVSVAHACSYAIVAILVWATPNTVGE